MTVNKLTGELRNLGQIGGNHQAWETDDSWLAASSGMHLIRFAADERGFVHRIGSHNSRIGHSTYWAEAHPAMSLDGTKLCYASSMHGDIDFHFIVMMLPGRPVEVGVKTSAGQAKLSWTPPCYAKEILGYHVYRSRRSGANFKQITKEPVVGTVFNEELPGGDAWYYRVTAVEHCAVPKILFV